MCSHPCAAKLVAQPGEHGLRAGAVGRHAVKGVQRYFPRPGLALSCGSVPWQEPVQERGGASVAPLPPGPLPSPSGQWWLGRGLGLLPE